MSYEFKLEPTSPEGSYRRMGAIISPDGIYRYLLFREWDVIKPLVLWLMHNPSTADGATDDATLKAIVRISRDWGFGGLLVGNLYAYRATDPKALLTVADPVGPDNDEALRVNSRLADTVVCAWGKLQGPKKEERIQVALALVFAAGHDAKAVKLGKHGDPYHPLYQASTLAPVLYQARPQTP